MIKEDMKKETKEEVMPFSKKSMPNLQSRLPDEELLEDFKITTKGSSHQECHTKDPLANQ